MPTLWLKHENPDVQPYAVPYDEGQNTDAIVAAYAESGWSVTDAPGSEPSEPSVPERQAAQPVKPPVQPVQPANPKE